MRRNRYSHKLKLRRMVRTALFAAVLAVLSQLFIVSPFGVPITLQTFGVALCTYVSKKYDGVLAVFVYILLGAVGLPVFHGFSGGFYKLLSVTGGFIIGFLPQAFLCAVGKRFSRVYAVLFGFLGVMLCHLFGTVHYSVLTSTDLFGAFLTVSLPFLAKDLLSSLAAYLVSLPIERALSRLYR